MCSSKLLVLLISNHKYFYSPCLTDWRLLGIHLVQSLFLFSNIFLNVSKETWSDGRKDWMTTGKTKQAVCTNWGALLINQLKIIAIMDVFLFLPSHPSANRITSFISLLMVVLHKWWKNCGDNFIWWLGCICFLPNV